MTVKRLIEILLRYKFREEVFFICEQADGKRIAYPMDDAMFGSLQLRGNDYPNKNAIPVGIMVGNKHNVSGTGFSNN